MNDTILHRTTGQRGERLKSPLLSEYRVQLPNGSVATWKENDALLLDNRATDLEIRLALALKLTIREVRAARKGCGDCATEQTHPGAGRPASADICPAA